MAKKSLQPIPERESSFLVKSKEVFKEELNERILHGEEYLKLEIKTIDDFEMIKKEYSLWHDYNLELLKQTFNEPYNEYRKEYNEIQKLELISSEKINSLKEIKGNENISIVTNTDKATIEIDFIDSTDFFILEVNHTGELVVKGRISETGNLLHTEPKIFTNFNFVFLIFFIVISFYNLTFLGDENDILKVGTNLFLLFGIYGVFRFIHSIFFIPDSLTSKYLDTKDKFAKEFKY